MVIYLVGKYSGWNTEETINNIETAGKVAVELWDKGYAVVSPHMNSALFEHRCHTADYYHFLISYMEIMARCDVVVMLPNWVDSQGAKMERAYAESLGMGIYEYPNLPALPELPKNLSDIKKCYESE